MVGSLAFNQIPQFLAPSNCITEPSEHKLLEQASSSSLLPFLRQLSSIEEFKKVHAQYIKLGLDRIPRHAGDLLLACTISDWGSMDYALSIFLTLDEPGTFDFNTLIRGYVKHHEPEAALIMYKEMQERSVAPDNFTFPFALKACAVLPAIREGTQIHGHVAKLGFECDVFVQNSLINLYGKCGEIELASKVFDQLGSYRTVASWSALLAALTRMSFWGECLTLFATMTNEERLRADESSMVSALSSCTHLGAYDLGRSIHCSLLRNTTGLNIIMQTSLIDMYAKCGFLEKGIKIYEKMPEKNAWAYSAIISGLAIYGEGKRALQVFESMLKEGHKPDEAIYVGVLSSCSHAGLLEEGLHCFDRMRFEHRITPNSQHYGCMVDLMARAGKLEEAYKLIMSMPMGPTDTAWRSLLSACKIHGNLELAECACRNLMQLDAQNSGDFIILADMYAKEKRWDDAARIRTEIANKELTQIPGCSAVEVKGRMHIFFSQDKSHPQSEEVNEMLYQMEWQLRFERYTPDTSEVFNDVDGEEKKVLLRGHSQKLAIAFALLNTSKWSTIRIITNIRMSRECHTYTALISRIFGREIVVRDRSRFHCFRNGECTCGEYW
ncbi:pentatricopeptide repeat-containing protein At1g31920 [Ananas comosus]|uniref:Pentatricopeptide repeat-containing protein At1g31920 n=1 Tax=Ananas comosus TaxID=4615 RepID=A0A6P5ELG0_ANACO|nr:pentatricopeptide repeat-containing protein At1g31920 [Ananas comosus]